MDKEFLEAIRNKNIDQVLKLLNTGIDPNVSYPIFSNKPNYRHSALYYAVDTEDNEEIINLLLEQGARATTDVVVKALFNYRKDLIEKLLQHGANLKEKNSTNTNPLHYLAELYREDSAEICQVLIKYGADVNQESVICRTTPLFAAIDKCNFLLIDILLHYGAQPCREMDAPEGKGVPLEYAFFFLERTVKNMIKYAALQVNHSDDKELTVFFSYFSYNAVSREKSMPYLRFAQDCMAEINALKEYALDNKGLTMFDFIISQGDTLETLQGNQCVTDLIFEYLLRFPIYCDVIMKKLDRSIIVRKVRELAMVENKVTLNVYCTEQILKYLSTEDLWNLFVAYKAT